MTNVMADAFQRARAAEPWDPARTEYDDAGMPWATTGREPAYGSDSYVAQLVERHAQIRKGRAAGEKRLLHQAMERHGTPAGTPVFLAYIVYAKAGIDAALCFVERMSELPASTSGDESSSPRFPMSSPDVGVASPEQNDARDGACGTNVAGRNQEVSA